MVGITSEICSEYQDKEENHLPRFEKSDFDVVPFYKRIRNTIFQASYFDHLIDSLDTSYNILREPETRKLFQLLENLVANLYVYSSNRVNKTPQEILELHSKSMNRSRASVATNSNSDESNLGLNSTISTSLVESSDLKLKGENYDESGLELQHRKIDYWDAIQVLCTLPEIPETLDHFLATINKLESGGLSLMRILVDKQLFMDYKLFQCFILNFFIWGSHPMTPYYPGKENIDYQNSIASSLVNCHHCRPT